jgi:hypothetical protein
MDALSITEKVVSICGFGLAIWQIMKTRTAAEAARESAREAVGSILKLQAISSIQDIAGRTRNLLILIKAQKLPAAASAALDLREAVARYRAPNKRDDDKRPDDWTAISVEVSELHDRIESMALINRWTTDERETLIHRTSRLHSKISTSITSLTSSGE